MELKSANGLSTCSSIPYVDPKIDKAPFGQPFLVRSGRRRSRATPRKRSPPRPAEPWAKQTPAEKNLPPEPSE